MDDWENLSAHVIKFIESSTATPRIKVFVDDGTYSSGYDGCNGAPGKVGEAHLGFDNGYHELGHVIGLEHEFMRNDRDHYVIVRDHQHSTPGSTSVPVLTACADGNNYTRCSSASLIGSFGPYDYRSVMQYQPTHPDITRWDGAPIVPGTACDQFQAFTPPSQCSNASCTVCNSNIPSSGYVFCPTCTQCNPSRMPTLEDGAAVAELYTPTWGVFSRMANVPTTAVPFDTAIAPGVTIQPNSNPAIETWGDVSLSVYVTGSDQHIYQRTKLVNNGQVTWSSWVDLGGVANSDPSVASWAPGRSDLVHRGSGNAIYIRTNVLGSWGGWGGLGAPPGGAQSSPSITTWGPDRLDIFVRGSADQLYVKSCTASCNGASGTWSSWSVAVPNGTFRGKPAAVSRTPGVNDIFVQGMDGTLWATWYNSTGPGYWYQVAGTHALGWNSSHPESYSPAPAARGANTLDVFVRGQDDKLWVTTWVGGQPWSAFSPLGGVLASSPATVSRVRTTNRDDVVAFMLEETVANTWNTAPWWKQFPSP